MAVAPELVLAASAIIGTGVNAVQQADAAGEAKKATDEAAQKQQALVDQAKKEQADEKRKAQLLAERNARIGREEQTAGRSQSPLLTGPFGLPSGSTGGTKTLLGL